MVIIMFAGHRMRTRYAVPALLGWRMVQTVIKNTEPEQTWRVSQHERQGKGPYSRQVKVSGLTGVGNKHTRALRNMPEVGQDQEEAAPTNIARLPGRSELSEIYRCWQSHTWLREHFSPRLPGKRKKKSQNSLSGHFLVVILLSCSVPLWCLTTHSPELGELRPENGKWEEGVFVDHDGCGIRESPWVPRSPLNKQTSSTSPGWAGPPGQVTSALDSLNL